MPTINVSSSTMRIKTFGYLMLFLALLINASITVAFKFASNISYMQLLFFVSLIGTVTSAMFMFAKGKQGNVREYVTHKGQFAAMAAFGVLVYTFLELIFGYTTHYVGASFAAVIYRTWPLMLLVMAPFILREKISKWDALGVTIGFTGLIAVLVAGGSVGLPVMALPFVGLLLLSAFFDAFCSAISKRYYYEIYSSIFMYNLISFAIFLPLALFTGNISLSGISMTDLLAILFLGVLQNVLLTLVFVNSFRAIKTAIASNLYILTPFVTMVISYFLLGEAILPSYLIIAGTVGIGLIIQQLAPKGSNYISHGKDKTAHLTIYDITSAFVKTSDPLIYNAMKGDGRVLALHIPNGRNIYGKQEEEFISGENPGIGSADSGSGNICILFTEKSGNITLHSDESEFIRDLLSLKDGDMLFMGVGMPSRVEEEFNGINAQLNNHISSTGQDVLS